LGADEFLKSLLCVIVRGRLQLPLSMFHFQDGLSQTVVDVLTRPAGGI
jgi:hypothetical protein